MKKGWPVSLRGVLPETLGMMRGKCLWKLSCPAAHAHHDTCCRQPKQKGTTARRDFTRRRSVLTVPKAGQGPGAKTWHGAVGCALRFVEFSFTRHASEAPAGLRSLRQPTGLRQAAACQGRSGQRAKDGLVCTWGCAASASNHRSPARGDKPEPRQ